MGYFIALQLTYRHMETLVNVLLVHDFEVYIFLNVIGASQHYHFDH